ncbi:hypothetical protein B0A50_00659 [Salinomyces thailandicus]|uniref:HhH-GPD domain-containing protein n=1 Tax=Salinomyces thailandicus TaxID=706561 RepID=A0A4U0UET8_9PEZI|nr:hypothetical protein B0A50_00659 [Salinomyces thailandica]
MRRSARIAQRALQRDEASPQSAARRRLPTPEPGPSQKRAKVAQAPVEESSSDGREGVVREEGEGGLAKKVEGEGGLAKKRVGDGRLADKKWQAWSAHATSSPFPDFGHPTPQECECAYRVLDDMHGAAVEEEFRDPETPDCIPHVLDAIVVALLSQATSWNNAKRAMRSMKEEYGSVFAYDDIVSGGKSRLQETIRCGGLHVRKSNLLMGILEQVWDRIGKWDLDELFDLTDEEAMKELMSYKGIGPKSAFVVLSWCLKRNPFTVDTHVYRIAGLWSWRPKDCTRELTQSHLNATVPQKLKFKLHFLLIQHGRSCPACRGGSKGGQKCEARERMKLEL